MLITDKMDDSIASIQAIENNPKVKYNATSIILKRLLIYFFLWFAIKSTREIEESSMSLTISSILETI